MSDTIKELDNLDREINHPCANSMDNLWLRALRVMAKDHAALAAKVEALEKRQQEPVTMDMAKRIASLESQMREVPNVEQVQNICTYYKPVSGGPKREQGSEPLMHNPEGTQCGDCGGTHEHYHDPKWLRAQREKAAARALPYPRPLRGIKPPPREADAGQEAEWPDVIGGGQLSPSEARRIVDEARKTVNEAYASLKQPPPPAPAATERQEQQDFDKWVATQPAGQAPGGTGYLACEKFARAAFAAGRESQWRDASKEKPERGFWVATAASRATSYRAIARWDGDRWIDFREKPILQPDYWMPLPPLPTKEGA